MRAQDLTTAKTVAKISVISTDITTPASDQWRSPACAAAEGIADTAERILLWPSGPGMGSAWPKGPRPWTPVHSLQTA
jgi:hypothetical protein